MDPLTFLRLVGAIVTIGVCWEGFFATFPFAVFGPWFLGRYMFWLRRDGLHWHKGYR